MAILLQPALTGTLLAALTLAPPQIREPLLANLQSRLSDNTIAKIITGLQWLFALGLLATFNKFMNTWAGNNFGSNARSKFVWSKEIILITGGTGGFGLRLCKDFAAKGLTVISVDVRDEAPSDIKNNPRVHYYKCDITNKAAVNELQATVKKNHGDPSILINNAGIAVAVPILEVPEDRLRAIFNVNAMAHWWTVQAFLPAMLKANKGHVMTIASVASFVSPPGMSAYSATKAAAMAFHEALTGELRTTYKKPDIKTSLVHPTFAATPMVAPFGKDLKKARQKIIDPKLVTDAIVKQILSCSGGQVIIAPGTEYLGTLRAWPSWMYHGLMSVGSKLNLAPAVESSVNYS